MSAPILSSSFKSSENDILRMLEQLEGLMDGSMHLFSHAIWIDTDKFFAITGRMRQQLPEDIRRASKVARDSEKIIEQAKVEAERIRAEAAEDGERIVQDGKRTAERFVRDAQEQAARLLDEHEILRQAQQEGRNLLAQTTEDSEAVRRGADEYAADVLGQMDEALSRALGSVRRGLEKLGRETPRE